MLWVRWHIALTPMYPANRYSFTTIFPGHATAKSLWNCSTTRPRPSSVVVYDDETPIYPTNIARDEEKNTLDVTFMATDVPAIGYKVFDVRAEEAGSRTTPLKVDEENLTFENDYIKMKINPETGYISSLQYRDGDSWRETFAQNVGTEGAELHVYKDTEVRPPQNFDVWELNASEMNKEPDWIVDGAPKSISIVGKHS